VAVHLAAGPHAIALGVAIVAVAACGGSPSVPRRAAHPTSPCAAQVRAAVASAAGAGLVQARTTSASPGLATCVYEAKRLSVRALVDTNPQAAVRFDRAVVERAQVAVWSGHHERAPRLLHGIGQGADWFPADREILATDGRKFVSITLVRSSLPARNALRLAMAAARATLRHAR
jgi:hypothetical protein